MASQEPVVQSPKDKTKNLDFEADFSIRLCRRLFMFYGLWPYSTHGRYSWYNVIKIISPFVVFYSIAIRVVPNICDIITRNGEDGVHNSIFRDFSRISAVTVDGIKYSIMRYYKQEIKTIIEQIKTDWRYIESPSEKKIMSRHARLSHVASSVFVAISMIGTCFLTLSPIIAKPSKPPVINGTEIKQRDFTVPSNFVFSVATQSPLYEILYWSQVLGTVIIQGISITAFSFFAIIVSHGVGKLKILMIHIEKFVDAEPEDDMHSSAGRKLAEVIQNHNRILKFIAVAEKTLRHVCLLGVGTYTFLMGYAIFLARKLLSLEKLNNFQKLTLGNAALFSVQYILNILSMCFIGELLATESTRVGQVAYLTDWHRVPRKISLRLILIMVRAAEPATITAGGVVPLSMAFYTSVIKTSFAYVNLLRTFT